MTTDQVNVSRKVTAGHLHRGGKSRRLAPAVKRMAITKTGVRIA
jgi:hypothetical protein